MSFTRRSVVLGVTSGTVLIVSKARPQLRATPSAMVGPFYPAAHAGEVDNDLTLVSGRGQRAAGKIIEVTGRVLGPRGMAVPRARVELWQANAAGRYAHPADSNPAPLDPNFQGFARLVTAADGSYRYTTVKPGAYPDGVGKPRPPHIHLDITGNGRSFVTQMLFPGEPLNHTDDVVPQSDRQGLIARSLGRSARGALLFEWNIVLDDG